MKARSIVPAAVLVGTLAAASCGAPRSESPAEKRDGEKMRTIMEAMQREMKRIEDNVSADGSLQAVVRAADEIGRMSRELAERGLDDKVYAAYLATLQSEPGPDSRGKAEELFNAHCRAQKRACETVSEAANAFPVDWGRLNHAVGAMRRACAQCHKSFSCGGLEEGHYR
jgi:hypothetical protein